MEVYPDDHRVMVVRAAGVPGEQRVLEVPLYELDRLDVIDHLTTVVVPALPNDLTRRRDPWFVADLVRRLRGPDGCPWDRKQTHESLRRYVIEEAYEVADAIDAGDPDALADELGDLYLQILLHAQIASESGDFDLRDVYAALAEKLIRRHPHVFGQESAQSASDARARWEDMKRAERAERAAVTGGDAPQSILAEVRRGRPAWMVAKALQEKAAEVGFDWDRVTEVADKVREEAAELAAEIERAGGSDARVAEELGDVLFAIVNLARWLDLDVEESLAKANRKFEQRFRHVERRVRESGRPWSDFSLAELDEYWNEAKIQADSLEQQEFAGKGRIT
jgi:tetrapyrrole methylase family protein/MazG family protein